MMHGISNAGNRMRDEGIESDFDFQQIYATYPVSSAIAISSGIAEKGE
jgi:hypothetical protein